MNLALHVVAWSAPYGAMDGSDVKATAESFVIMTNDYPRWVEWNLTKLTRQWVSGSTVNNGVMLRAENEDTDGYDLRFYSSETANSADRPYLEVTWSQTAKTVYFLKDYLGSIRATVDETGAVVGYDDYDPWGKVLARRSLAT